MKKRITLLLSMLCLLAMVIALDSCGHEHAFGAEWKQDDTNHWHACEAEGECAEVSGKAAHSFAVVSTIDSTCTVKGEKVEKCSICGYEKKTELALAEHDYNENIIAPTCTEGGKTIVTCNAEGCTYSAEKDITAPTGHAWQGASCEAADICSACGATQGEALGHDFSERVVAPTCTRDGYTETTCSRCDYLDKTTDVTPALGHKFNIVDNPEEGTYRDVVAPTCTEVGKRYFKCTVCNLIPINDANNVVDIPALGHDPVEEVVPPTCVLGGFTEITCSRCEDLYETKDNTDPTGHTIYKGEDAQLGTHYKITFEPNCIEKGELTYVCTVCGELSEDAADKAEVPALGHNMVVFVEPWCGNNSQIEYKCDRVCRGVECGETSIVTAENEYRHVYNDGSVVVPATCVDNGVYRCLNCDTTFTAYDGDEIGQKTGIHVYDTLVEVVAPTCAKEGYTTYGCSAGACGTTENRDVTPRSAHYLSDATEFGTITCFVCNKSYANVTADKVEGSDNICFGCGKDPCECGTTADWEGYINPDDPFALTANTTFSISTVDDKALVLGSGIIVLESDAAATFTVVIYADANGEATYTFTVVGNGVVDLYQYATVSKVEITSTADATAVLYGAM